MVNESVCFRPAKKGTRGRNRSAEGIGSMATLINKTEEYCIPFKQLAGMQTKSNIIFEGGVNINKRIQKNVNLDKIKIKDNRAGNPKNLRSSSITFYGKDEKEVLTQYT